MAEGVPPPGAEALQQRVRSLEARVRELQAENQDLRRELQQHTQQPRQHTTAVTSHVVAPRPPSTNKAFLSRQQSTARHQAEVQQLNQQHAQEIETLRRSISSDPGGSRGHWECTVDGGWTPFSAEINVILSGHFCERNVVEFEREGWPYAVDFSAAVHLTAAEAAEIQYEQVNTITKVSRSVRWQKESLAIPRWPDYFGAATSSRPGCVFQLESVVRSPEFAVLSKCIQPADPRELGKGGHFTPATKQVWQAIAPERRTLQLKQAWRIHHGARWLGYLAAKEGVKAAMQRVPPERRHFLGRPDGTLRTEFDEATAQLPGELERLEANEAYLLTGLPSDRVLDVLETGMNEKLSYGGNFGCGSYFAEDATKNDQYTGDASAEPPELRQVLFPHGGEDAATGYNYMLLCRVALGCSVRTEGMGRLPKCLDSGAVAENSEGKADHVFWSHGNDPGPVPEGHPEYEARKKPDFTQWRELGRVAGVANPCVIFHSLVVEALQQINEEAMGALQRGVSASVLVNEGMLGAVVQPFREFVVFDGGRICKLLLPPLRSLSQCWLTSLLLLIRSRVLVGVSTRWQR